MTADEVMADEELSKCVNQLMEVIEKRVAEKAESARTSEQMTPQAVFLLPIVVKAAATVLMATAAGTVVGIAAASLASD